MEWSAFSQNPVLIGGSVNSQSLNKHHSCNSVFTCLCFSQCYVNLLFWYQFFCGFSGSTMLDYWQMIFFNLFFTSVPPLLFGVLDKDVSAETLLRLPELYRNGQNSEVCHDCWNNSLITQRTTGVFCLGMREGIKEFRLTWNVETTGAQSSVCPVMHSAPWELWHYRSLDKFKYDK